MIQNYNWLTINQWLKQIKIIAKRVEKVQTILVLDYKNRNNCKIFHSNAKLIASDSGIDVAFNSMHQSILIKTKNNTRKDWIVVDAIIKHRIKISECSYISRKIS